ncbi:MAG TPA: pyrimidine reductase family protein [Micromonosporaceae bacterium]|nr:pyrimidine reductase family protein [Micromonosporaceae bacterium]
MRAVWPSPGIQPLDDDALLRAYPVGDEPLMRANFVASVDGAVTADGKSGGLGGPADKRIFDLLRVQCDAVMVGAGTLRIEGYGAMTVDDRHRELRRRSGRAPQPALVVVSGRLDLDPAHAMFREAPVRPFVLTHDGAPAGRRKALSEVAEVVVCGREAIDFRAARAVLVDAGYPHVLCEGGPHVLGALTAADAVDELCLTVSPRLLGPGAGRITAGPVSAVRDLEVASVLAASDGFLFLRYRVSEQPR